MRSPKIETTCQHCQKPFFVHSYRIKNGTGKYCQQSCYLASRWGERQACKTCGKKSKHRYCSDSCRKEFWNKNGYAIYERANRYWKRKISLINDLGGECVHCGNSDIRVLDIDHIDPSKKMQPGQGRYSWSHRFKDWEKNIGNLRILCSNCHRIHTWDQRGFGPNE